jgi:hypothetical protein
MSGHAVQRDKGNRLDAIRKMPAVGLDPGVEAGCCGARANAAHNLDL